MHTYKSGAHTVPRTTTSTGQRSLSAPSHRVLSIHYKRVAAGQLDGHAADHHAGIIIDSRVRNESSKIRSSGARALSVMHISRNRILHFGNGFFEIHEEEQNFCMNRLFLVCVLAESRLCVSKQDKSTNQTPRKEGNRDTIDGFSFTPR